MKKKLALVTLAAAAALSPMLPLQAEEWPFPDGPVAVAPHVSDRAFWEAQRKTPVAKAIIERADAKLKWPIVVPPDEYYLDYSRKSGPHAGNRTRYQEVTFRLSGCFADLAFAYALTEDPKYLPRLAELVTALCDSMRTWVLPAHDTRLTNFNRTEPTIDLVSSTYGGFFAQFALILKGRLPAESEAKIRREVFRQVIEPVEKIVNRPKGEKPPWWYRTTNNWNAVCHSGVQLALLASEMDPARRRRLLADSMEYEKRYLEGFLDDGYSSEGIGYWNYGFVHYLHSAGALYLASNGKVNLLDDPKAKLAAALPERLILAPGVYPSISDCSSTTRINIATMQARDWLLGVESAFRAGVNVPDFVPNRGASITTLLCMRMPPAPPEAAARKPAPLPRFTEFPSADVYIMRPEGAGNRLTALFKGGNNHEMHNHNDCGEFILAVDGVPLAVDPGATVYSRETFSAQRYQNRIINSFCHNVPTIDDRLQTAGEKTEVRRLRREQGDHSFEVVFDLRAPYRTIPGIQKLERTMRYDWTKGGAVTVADEFEFAEPRVFESAVNTYGSWRRADDRTIELIDKGKTLRIAIDTAGVPFEITATEVMDNNRNNIPVKRLGIRLKDKVKSGRVVLTASVPK